MGRPLNEVTFGLVAPEEIPDLEKPLPKNVLFSLDETLRKRCSSNINSVTDYQYYAKSRVVTK